MNKQRKYDIQYMRIAYIIAEASHARKKKVGCLIVKGTTIIADGFNGMPSGFDNDCETPLYDRSLTYPVDPFDEEDNLDFKPKDWLTKPEVLHAESNALMKLTRSTVSSEGATLYTTWSPCLNCAKLIIQAGIQRVVYNEDYKDNPGLQLLHCAGIKFEKIILT